MTARSLFSALCFLFATASAAAQEGEQILSQADEFLRYEDGVYTGRLWVYAPEKRRSDWLLTIHRQEPNSLYDFRSRTRGREERILYDSGDENVWVREFASEHLRHRRDGERFATVLRSGFSYLDLALRPFSADYVVEDSRPYKWQGKERLRLTLLPRKKEGYGKLYLLTDPQKGQRPLRVDYHGPDNLLFKSLKFYYDFPVRNRDTKKSAAIRAPVKMDMEDFRENTRARIEIYEYYASRMYNTHFFDPKYF